MPKNIKKYIKNSYQKTKTNPDKYLLALLVFLLPFERIPSLDIFGITFRLSLLVAGIVIIRAAFKFYQSKRKISASLPIYLLIAIIVWLATLVAIGINLQRGVMVVVFTAFVFLTALSIAYLIKKEYLELIIKSLLLSSAIAIVFGFYQYFGNLFNLPNWLTGMRQSYSWEIFGFPRIQSVALEPLYYASYLLLPLSFAFLYQIYNKKPLLINKKFILLLVTLTSASIFLTVSRGGIVAMLIQLILLSCATLLSRLTNWKNLLFGFVTIIFGLIIALVFINYLNKSPVSEKTTKGAKGTKAYASQITKTGLEGGGDDRAKFRKKALEIWQKDTKIMLIGIGPGQFGPYIQNNKKDDIWGWAIVNNLPLELLVETGLIGLLLFAIFIISMLYGAIKAYIKEKDLLKKFTLLALIVFVIATLIQYQTFSTLYIMHFWVAIGLLMGVCNIIAPDSLAPKKGK